jgi:predicted nuclease of restriction endonuclease-like RecB superfamily
MLLCKFCGKECKSLPSLGNHQSKCPSNPNRKYVSYTAGKPAWNKGLSKESDDRVKKNGESIRERIKKVGHVWQGRTHSDETKKILSQKASINNKGGRSKWYDVAGQKVQGTWERNVASKLEELGVKWTKLKTRRDILEYVMDGKTRSYTPDFYLPDHDVYLEIKGHWWGRDKEKMSIVLETHKDKKIVILEKADYEKVLRGELVW